MRACATRPHPPYPTASSDFIIQLYSFRARGERARDRRSGRRAERSASDGSDVLHHPIYIFGDTGAGPLIEAPTGLSASIFEFLKHTGLEQVAAVGGSKTLRMT